MGSNKTAVLTTLLYSDIFHFPLTIDEIHRFLIHSKPLSKETIRATVRELHAYVIEEKGYVRMRSCSRDIINRIKNIPAVEKKMKLAQSTAKILAYIPTIRFLGVSGGLAVKNVSEQDDIDIFIITFPRTVWVTRLLVLTVLQFMGLRRSRNKLAAANKICVNMIIDRRSLAFSSERHDVYTAREIAQVFPLLDRAQTWALLYQQNNWLYSFLPNTLKRTDNTQSKIHVIDLACMFLTVGEPIARFFQLLYMKRTKTTEIANKTFAAFHPHDYRLWVREALQKKLQQYNFI
jgi:hypothetical protein